MFTITRPPVSRHFPDDDLPRIPELSPMDSPQARRAARQDAGTATRYGKAARCAATLHRVEQ